MNMNAIHQVLVWFVTARYLRQATTSQHNCGLLWVQGPCCYLLMTCTLLCLICYLLADTQCDCVFDDFGDTQEDFFMLISLFFSCYDQLAIGYQSYKCLLLVLDTCSVQCNITDVANFGSLISCACVLTLRPPQQQAEYSIPSYSNCNMNTMGICVNCYLVSPQYSIAMRMAGQLLSVARIEWMSRNCFFLSSICRLCK